MKFSKYQLQISEWVQKYGVPARVRSYNPSEAKLCCEKCGKHKRKMARHHKANDLFFAKVLPDEYAARYIEFRKEDVAKLCAQCHTNIERYSKRLKNKLYMANDFRIRAGVPATKEWCELWRSDFLALYDKWIKIPKRRKHR